MTTRQCAELGLDPSWVDRQVRSGHWQRLHRGVLVTHSGPLAWRTRARAGILFAGAGAALSHWSAAYVLEFSARPPRTIDISIPAKRKVRPSAGLVIHRRRRPFDTRGRLPTTGRADTVLDLVGQAASDDDAIALLCDAVRAGVHAQEVLEELDRRPWARGRDLTLALLADVAEGVESALERRYRYRVERAHGLPPARLQVRHRLDDRWVRADCVYEGLGVRIELDGVLAHPGGRTDADVWRDNATVISLSQLTLRYRWLHVQASPCATAAQVAAALTSRGWRGRPRPCGPACSLR